MEELITIKQHKNNAPTITTHYQTENSHSRKEDFEEQLIILSMLVQNFYTQQKELTKRLLFVNTTIDSLKALCDSQLAEKWSSGILPCNLLLSLSEKFKFIQFPKSVNEKLANLNTYTIGCK